MEHLNSRLEKRTWAALVALPVFWYLGAELYREYTQWQNRRRIDALSLSQVVEEIRKNLQGERFYKINQKKGKDDRYPQSYRAIEYSPVDGKGLAFADYTQFATGIVGVSYVDRNVDGLVDWQIGLRRTAGNNDTGLCFENLSECNDKTLQDRITRETRRSEVWTTAQAQYEAGLREFLKGRYIK